MNEDFGFTVFSVCLTIILLFVIYSGFSFNYRTKIKMAQAGYEQVVLPGHTSLAWQKVRSSK